MTDEMRIEAQLDAFYKYFDRYEEPELTTWYTTLDYYIFIDTADEERAREIVNSIMKDSKVDDFGIEKAEDDGDAVRITVSVSDYCTGYEAFDADDEIRRKVEKLLKKDDRVLDYDWDFKEAEAA